MRGESLNSAKVRFFKLDYNRVMDELKRYALRLLNRGVKLVILIGSLAKGNYTAFSDADIIIIADSLPRNPLERIPEFIDPDVSIDLDIRAYTLDEISRMAREKRRIIKEIIQYGKLLAGDKKLINEIKELYEESRDINK